jgi:hypothetical protein
VVRLWIGLSVRNLVGEAIWVPGEKDGYAWLACLIVQLFTFLASWCSAQTWDVNALSRCNSKFCIISSKELPGRARRVEPPGTFGAAPTPKAVFFDPNELVCRRHYRRKTKFRVQMFCTIFLSLSLEYAASFSALMRPFAGIGATCCFDTPPSKSGAPESVGSIVYLWGQARTNGNESVPRLTGH